MDKESDYLTIRQFKDISRYLNKNFLQWLDENNIKDIREIKGLDLQLFFKSKQKSDKKWAYKTRKNCLSAIMAFFRWTVTKAELLDKIPAVPDIGRPEKKVIQWLTPEQQKDVLKHLPSHYEGLVKFLMVYGCRPAEAMGLQLSSVDWKNEIIYIRTVISDGVLKERTKTNKIRSLPFLPEIVPHLKDAAKNRIGDGYLFLNSKTQDYFRHSAVSRAWAIACKSAGCEGFTLQEGTRKSVTNAALERGVDIRVISDALGNSPRVIKEHYGQISASRNLQAFTEVRPLKAVKNKKKSK